MSEHGEISVANLANFGNAPKFVIVNGEEGQKLFIMSDKLNNELIKDIYDEYSKPKITFCNKEEMPTNDECTANLNPVNDISIINEQNIHADVLNNSGGEEVNVSVTLKIKNDKSNQVTNDSINDTLISCEGSKVTSVNENNSFASKQNQEAVNSTIVATDPDKKDSKSDTEDMKLNSNENKETFDCNNVCKKKNSDLKVGISDSFDTKEENTEIKRVNEGSETGQKALCSIDSSKCPMSIDVNLSKMNQLHLSNVAKEKSLPINAVNKEVPECHPHSMTTLVTNEDSHKITPSTTPELLDKSNQPLDNKNKAYIINDAVKDQINTHKLDSSPAKNDSIFAREINPSPKLDKNNEEIQSFNNINQNCYSGKEINLSKNNFVLSRNNASSIESLPSVPATSFAPSISYEPASSSAISPVPLTSSVNATPYERKTPDEPVASSAPLIVSSPIMTFVPVSSSASVTSTAPVTSFTIPISSAQVVSSLPVTSNASETPSISSTSTAALTSSASATSTASVSSAYVTSTASVTSSASVTSTSPTTSFMPSLPYTQVKSGEPVTPLVPETSSAVATSADETIEPVIEITQPYEKVNGKIDIENIALEIIDTKFINHGLNEFPAGRTDIPHNPNNDVNNALPVLSIFLENQGWIDNRGSHEKLDKIHDGCEKSGTTFQENFLQSPNDYNCNQPIIEKTKENSKFDSPQMENLTSESDKEISKDVNKLNHKPEITATGDYNLKGENTYSSNEGATPRVVEIENEKQSSNTKIEYQTNGMKIDENLMMKINETLIKLFIETTNNNRDFDPAAVKEAALKGFMKLYGKELAAYEERYQKQVDDLSKKLAEKQQEAKDLSVELKEAKKASLKKDSSEQQKYEIQIDQLKTKIREEEAKAESVRVELQYARNEVEFSKAKMRRLEEDLTKANELADSLQERNANHLRSSTRIKELEDLVKNLEDKLRKSEFSRKDLETSLADIETERDEEMKIVQDALDEAADERQELITSFKKELELLNTTNTAREQQMLEDFEWKLHEMEKEYKSKLEDNNRQAENTLQRAKRHSDEDEVRQKLEKQRNEINAEWEDKLRVEYSRLKTELDDLHSEEKHLAVESMKVQKEQEIQRLKKSWEQRQEEIATQVSSLKDSLAGKDAYYRSELDNQRTMADRDLWDLRMKLQKLNESSYDQIQQLEEKYREDMERLRVDYDERIKELETKLAICDAQKGVDLIGQMEKEHKMQMAYVGEQHQLSMERLREELDTERFQAVEDTRVIITNHHLEIETNLKEQLNQTQNNESQIRDELEAIRSTLQRREETLKTLEEELERYKNLKGDSSSSSMTSSFPPAASTTSSGFNSSQFSLASNESHGSRNSQDRYSYHDSVSLAEDQDDSQRNSGLLGKVFGGGWFTPSKSYSRRCSTPLSYKKPYS